MRSGHQQLATCNQQSVNCNLQHAACQAEMFSISPLKLINFSQKLTAATPGQRSFGQEVANVAQNVRKMLQQVQHRLVA